MVIDTRNLSKYLTASRPVVRPNIATPIVRDIPFVRNIPTSTLGIPTRASGYTPPGGWTSVVSRRPSISITSRPTITPTRIDINGGVLPRVVAGSSSLRPTVRTAASFGNGSPALSGGSSPTFSGGGFDLGLGVIGGQISSSVSGVIEQAKSFIPTAVKIIAAVVVIKIVLWLVRGRRR